MKEQELLKKKKEIQNAKTELAEIKGQEKALLNQLSEEYGCTSLEEAETLLTQRHAELEEIEDQINKKTEKLVNQYFKEED